MPPNLFGFLTPSIGPALLRDPQYLLPSFSGESLPVLHQRGRTSPSHTLPYHFQRPQAPCKSPALCPYPSETAVLCLGSPYSLTRCSQTKNHNRARPCFPSRKSCVQCSVPLVLSSSVCEHCYFLFLIFYPLFYLLTIGGASLLSLP